MPAMTNEWREMVQVKSLDNFGVGKKRLLKLQIANFRLVFISGGSKNLCMKWMLAYKGGLQFGEI